MKLSTDFSLDEFLESETADRLGVEMNPTTEVVVSLTALVNCLLQPLRNVVNSPIHITSGWRPMTVNQSVGGSDTSQHLLGEAADCYVTGLTPFELARRVVDSNLDFGQLIIYPSKGTVHLSYRRLGSNQREVLTHTDRGFVAGFDEED